MKLDRFSRASFLFLVVIAFFQSPHSASGTEATREFVFEKSLLNLPVKNGAAERVLTLFVDGRKVREFKIELSHGDPDFWVFLDIAEFQGRKGVLTLSPVEDVAPKGWESIHQDDSFPGEEELYRERLRPLFHFTSKRGWNNDPNGLVYYDGEYHLFYQHNPFGWRWGNMTWGHAVSRDLVHWEEIGDAIHPDSLGTIFSGSAAVDWNNTTGFKKGDEEVLVAAYTSAGGTNPWSEGQPFTQSIAYSNDRGRTWTIYEGNPVQGHLIGENRDPKIIWHEPTGQWAIVLYLDDNTLGFFNSKDLKTWVKTSELKSFYECPELFEIAFEEDPSTTKWVLYGGSGDYLVGHFDGREFHPETEVIKYHYGNCFYASQTFNDIPREDGRRIQIGWGRGDIPGMPFNQMMNFPTSLTLRRTEEGPRLFVRPVKEIEGIVKKSADLGPLSLENATKSLSGIRGGLYDIELTIEIGDAKEAGLILGSAEIVYDSEKRTLRFKDQVAPLTPKEGTIQVRILVDRTSVEIYANEGRVYMPVHHLFEEDDPTVALFTRGGSATFESVEARQLESIWAEATAGAP